MPVGDGSTHYDHLAVDPRNAKPAPGFGPRQVSGGVYTLGYNHAGGTGSGGYWVCIVASTTQAPPTVAGQSNHAWKWSNGPS